LEAFYEATSPLLNYYNTQDAQEQASCTTLQHPHQVSFDRPHKFKLGTLSAPTSDENWPYLDKMVEQFSALKERVPQTRHGLSDAMVASGLGAASAYRSNQQAVQ